MAPGLAEIIRWQPRNYPGYTHQRQYHRSQGGGAGDQQQLLDVGCNDGALLKWLEQHKQVRGRGIELSQARVSECLAKGLSVIQGNADTDLDYYPDNSVDYIILSQTLQALSDPRAVLEQLLRIGKRAIVSVPNFGYWPNRLQLMFRGRMPVTRELTYAWYDTPNIHFCTIRDFIKLCEELGYTIETSFHTNSFKRTTHFKGNSRLANIFG